MFNLRRLSVVLTLFVCGPFASLASAQNRAFDVWFAKTENSIRGLESPRSSSLPNFGLPEDISQTSPFPLASNRADKERIDRSLADYSRNFGQDSFRSFLWTGVESANPLSRDESYRWDSLKDAGMFNHTHRLLLVANLKRLGIRNIRLGISNQDIDLQNPQSWKPTTEMINDFYQAGMRISLDLHHFGIEDRFRVPGQNGTTDFEHSYYLNPEWPVYFAKFARQVVTRYNEKISAITLINEPETTVGFNGEMWHGGFPRWASGDTNFWYLRRSVQIARAAVLAKLEIEDYAANSKAYHHLVYVHTEAGIVKPYWEDFNLYRRFIISDLILGADWLTQTRFSTLIKSLETRHSAKDLNLENSTLGWIVDNFGKSGESETDRGLDETELMKSLFDLQKLHRKLNLKFGKTMRSDTIFALDYYAQNEDRDANLNPLRSEPEFYASEVQSGRRVGIRRLIIDYYNHFKMPMMIGETGTVYFDYGLRWHNQMLLEIAKAAQTGVPLVGYTLYPAIDTQGWENALSLSRSQSITNPSGLFDTDLHPRPFIIDLVRELKAVK